MARKNTDPNEKKPTKNKKATIIANAKYDDFVTEYERGKEQFAQHYPGGVEFIQASGYDELQNAFSNIPQDSDLIMMAHHNKDAMYGVPVADPTFRTFDAPQGKTLADLFKGLQSRGYEGNCYLGICHGEGVAADLQDAGVNIPIYATPAQNKWVGVNPGNKKSFEDFFFGVEGNPQSKTFGQGKSPEVFEDYLRKDKRQEELMNRRLEADTVSELTPLPQSKNGQKMKGNKKLPKANLGGYLNVGTNILQGVQMLGQEKRQRKETEKLQALANVVAQANNTAPVYQPNKYATPESQVIDPNSVAPTYGTGYSVLAKNGKKIKAQDGLISWANLKENIGNPENLQGGNMGQFVGGFLGGGNATTQTGAGKIGSTVGGIAGSLLGPVGGVVGSAIGGIIGGAVGGAKQKRQEQAQQRAYDTLSNAAFAQGVQGLRNSQYSGFMKNGGSIVEKTGELQMFDPNSIAQPISQNPYLPNGGETVMFKGPSHSNGGIPIQFGKTKVEVEGGEPAVMLKDGGTQTGLTIFGDMKIPAYGASEIGDPKAKGKKFKNYIDELSKMERKQNDVLSKGMELLTETPDRDSFDKLKMNSGKAKTIGANMKLKDIAQKKQMASIVQDAILSTAEQYNLDSSKLAEGEIKKAKRGAKIMGQTGVPTITSTRPKNPLPTEVVDYTFSTTVPVGNDLRIPNQGGFPGYPTSLSPTGLSPREDGFASSGDASQEGRGINWDDVYRVGNAIIPHIRPTNQTQLDPAQLAGEMYALASNQLEPVQAQTYQPLLEQVADISLQDQMNTNQADFNALARTVAGNPAAQSILAAQKYAANSAILGEQTRINQQNRLGTYNRNRATLNDATLKNLAILDQQYARQAQAKSNTKSVAQSALNSIAAKISQNKLENRTLGIQENLYNYRFNNKGYAWNVNPAFNPNIPQVAGYIPVDNEGNPIQTTTSERVISYDKRGLPVGHKEREKVVTKDGSKKRGGNLLREFKNY